MLLSVSGCGIPPFPPPLPLPSGEAGSPEGGFGVPRTLSGCPVSERFRVEGCLSSQGRPDQVVGHRTQAGREAEPERAGVRGQRVWSRARGRSPPPPQARPQADSHPRATVAAPPAPEIEGGGKGPGGEDRVKMRPGLGPGGARRVSARGGRGARTHLRSRRLAGRRAAAFARSRRACHGGRGPRLPRGGPGAAAAAAAAAAAGGGAARPGPRPGAARG